MKRFAMLGIVALALACVVAPSPALASTHKIPTALRGITGFLTVPAVHAPGKGAVISGRLVYRPLVKVGGKLRRVDRLMDGFVRLYRVDATSNNGRYRGVAGLQTVKGRFRFDVAEGGTYCVGFGGSHTRRASTYPGIVVEADALRLENFHTIAATHVADALEATVGVDIVAPVGSVNAQRPLWFRMAAEAGDASTPSYYALNSIQPSVTSSGTLPMGSGPYATYFASPGSYWLHFTYYGDQPARIHLFAYGQDLVAKEVTLTVAL